MHETGFREAQPPLVDAANLAKRFRYMPSRVPFGRGQTIANTDAHKVTYKVTFLGKST